MTVADEKPVPPAFPPQPPKAVDTSWLPRAWQPDAALSAKNMPAPAKSPVQAPPTQPHPPPTPPPPPPPPKEPATPSSSPAAPAVPIAVPMPVQGPAPPVAAAKAAKPSAKSKFPVRPGNEGLSAEYMRAQAKLNIEKKLKECNDAYAAWKEKKKEERAKGSMKPPEPKVPPKKNIGDAVAKPSSSPRIVPKDDPPPWRRLKRSNASENLEESKAEPTEPVP